jgi:hypothetical protein
LRELAACFLCELSILTCVYVKGCEDAGESNIKLYVYAALLRECHPVCIIFDVKSFASRKFLTFVLLDMMLKKEIRHSTTLVSC